MKQCLKVLVTHHVNLAMKPSFSQSLSLHSHASLADAYLLEFDHSLFGAAN